MKKKIKIQQQKDEEQYKRFQDEQSNGLVQLPEEERLSILQELQSKWDSLNRDYQKLSLTVDTVPKITRKVTMEQQLSLVEADIEKFSNPFIYVDFGREEA